MASSLLKLLLSTTMVLTILYLVFLTYVSTKRRKLCMPPSPWSLPLIGHLHLLSPLLHHSFQKLAAVHGPIFHIKLGSVPAIIVSSPDLAKLFLKTHELPFSNRSNSIAILRLTYNSPFATAPHGAYWKFIRKLIATELLGTKSLNEFSQLRKKETHRMLRGLRQKADKGETVNVTEELLTMMNGVIFEMVIGEKCSASEAQKVRVLVREISEIFGEFHPSDFIWICRNMDFNGYRNRFEDIHQRFDAVVENIVSLREEQRKQNKSEIQNDKEEKAKCFLDTLLDVMEDGKAEMQITRNQIKAIVLDLLTAATDTSGSTVEWALAELLNNPSVLNMARVEIDSVIGLNRVVEEPDVASLPYMQALMKETYRLHPPIPLIIRKSTEQVMIDGYSIPAGTILFVNNWAIGRSPEYWDNPLEFQPNRFLGSCVDVKGKHFELLPFGTGRRGCPGMRMVQQELPMVLGAMIQCFDWKAVGPDGKVMGGGNGRRVDMSERPGLTVPRAHELVCLVRARVKALDQTLE